MIAESGVRAPHCAAIAAPRLGAIIVAAALALAGIVLDPTTPTVVTSRRIDVLRDDPILVRTLDGVGPSLARRFRVFDRDVRSLEDAADLLAVPGLGPMRLHRLAIDLEDSFGSSLPRPVRRSTDRRGPGGGPGR